VLTLAIRHSRHLVHRIRHRHVARPQHLLVQLLLLQLLQLGVELVLVHGVSDSVTRNGVDNLIAERVLFSEPLPVSQSKPSVKHPGEEKIGL
jgi:hypothetical protein